MTLFDRVCKTVHHCSLLTNLVYGKPFRLQQCFDTSHLTEVMHAGSEMGRGDPGMEDIYNWDPVTGPRIAFKGPTGTAGQSTTIACCHMSCFDFITLHSMPWAYPLWVGRFTA